MKKSLVLTLILAGAPFVAVATGRAADAAALWGDKCAKCHGENGKGETKMGRKLSIADLTDAQVQAKFTDDEALKAMKEGVKDASGKQSMKPIEDLSEADMKSLIPFVRALKK